MDLEPGLTSQDVDTLYVDDQPVKPRPLDRVVSTRGIRVDHHEEVGAVVHSGGVLHLRLAFHLGSLSRAVRDSLGISCWGGGGCLEQRL